jgi:hypothetical protein
MMSVLYTGHAENPRLEHAMCLWPSLHSCWLAVNQVTNTLLCSAAPAAAFPDNPPPHPRHHRYIFEQKESKSKEQQQPAVIARMQELGPRFTLKLLSLQKGTFDSKYGEFEWVHKKDMDTSRRRFHL